MTFQMYIKRFCYSVIGIFLLSSCNIIGGKDKVEVSESSVLSGPPLAIPPEFDVNSENTNQQQSIPTYDDFETLDEADNISNFENEPVYKTSQDENIFTDEIPSMTNIDNTGEIQSFESFNPNLTRINKQSNNNVRVQKKYRATVPSDSYNFDRIESGTQKAYVQKKRDNFTGFGTTNFEQTEIRNNKGLSTEEEFLLEDIINQENIPSTIDETIPDFE